MVLDTINGTRLSLQLLTHNSRLSHNTISPFHSYITRSLTAKQGLPSMLILCRLFTRWKESLSFLFTLLSLTARRLGKAKRMRGPLWQWILLTSWSEHQEVLQQRMRCAQRRRGVHDRGIYPEMVLFPSRTWDNLSLTWVEDGQFTLQRNDPQESAKRFSSTQNAFTNTISLLKIASYLLPFRLLHSTTDTQCHRAGICRYWAKTRRRRLYSLL